jgi:hypothetical protein
MFLDEEAAAHDGGVVAPPTFINRFRDLKTNLVLSEAELDLPLLLHGEQAINYYKEIRPGDKIMNNLKIIDVVRKKSRTLES